MVRGIVISTEDFTSDVLHAGVTAIEADGRQKMEGRQRLGESLSERYVKSLSELRSSLRSLGLRRFTLQAFLSTVSPGYIRYVVGI